MRKQWVLANTIAGAIAGTAIVAVLFFPIAPSRDHILIGAVRLYRHLLWAGLVSGIILGVAQAVALRRIIRRAALWMVTTALLSALVVPSVMTVVFDMSDSDHVPVLPEFALPVALAAPSFALSVGQFLVLRREAQNAGGWIPIGSISFSIGITVMMFGALLLAGYLSSGYTVLEERWPMIVGATVAGAAAGWLYGTMTGSVLRNLHFQSTVVP